MNCPLCNLNMEHIEYTTFDCLICNSCRFVGNYKNNIIVEYSLAIKVNNKEFHLLTSDRFDQSIISLLGSNRSLSPILNITPPCTVNSAKCILQEIALKYEKLKAFS